MKKKTQTWYELAKNDFEFAKSLLKDKKRTYYCVHFCHQAIEKILKAVIQETTKEMPLRTHNLESLRRQAKLEMDHKHREFLLRLNPHYIGTKYPEDINKLYKIYSTKFVQNIFKNTEEIYKWLGKILKSKK